MLDIEKYMLGQRTFQDDLAKSLTNCLGNMEEENRNMWPKLRD